MDKATIQANQRARIAAEVREEADKIAVLIKERALAKRAGGPMALSQKVLVLQPLGAEEYRRVAEAGMRAACSAFLNCMPFTQAAIMCGKLVWKVVLSDALLAAFPDGLSTAELVSVGAEILDDVREATDGFTIEEVDEIEVQRAKGRAQHTKTYALVPKKKGFFEMLAEGGIDGQAAFVEKALPWIDGKTGGLGDDALDPRMVRASGEIVDSLNPEAQPVLFAALNAVQAVNYAVNAKVLAVVEDYDEGKAFDWLFKKFLADGLEEPAARSKAKAAARL